MALLLASGLLIPSLVLSFSKGSKYAYEDCDHLLSNIDFQYGTYRITESGKYCLTEDIEFNPNEGTMDEPNDYGSWYPMDGDQYPGCFEFSDGPYALGFFAVITIETSGVELDLKGHSIQMHWYFYLQQRFFSIIEIASTPFLPGVGPANFGMDFAQVSDVLIHNGEIGLSSHHGIHANNATNVTIEDLKINEFEVAGIALNGFKNAVLRDLDIGPSTRSVPFTGFYSNARFLAPALMKLLKSINESGMPEPMIEFSYSDDVNPYVMLSEVYGNLMDTMDIAFRYAANGLTEIDMSNRLYQQAMDLFISPHGIPDGSALYGIVLHSFNVAIGGFGKTLNEAGHGEDVLMENINIHDLELNVFELPAIYFDQCDDPESDSITILRGPFGDVMDVRRMVNAEAAQLIDELDVNGKDLQGTSYIGNVLSDAQIALELFREYPNEGEDDYGFRSYMPPRFLAWAVKNYYQDSAQDLPKCIDFVCNGDIMFHTNKGIFGIRMDLIENAAMKNVKIEGLINDSPLASCACGNYSGPHDGGNPSGRERQGTMHSDNRGISVTGGDLVIDGTMNVIKNLVSSNGDVAGIDLMEDSILEFGDGAEIKITKLTSGSGVDGDTFRMLETNNKTPYPNNFEMCYINLQDEAVVINQPNDGWFTCETPEFVEDYSSPHQWLHAWYTHLFSKIGI